MKRILSCLLAVLMLASLSVSAFAEGNVSKQPSTEVEELVSAVDAKNEDVTEKLEILQLRYSDRDELIALIENFNEIFDGIEGLRTATEKYGVEIGSAFLVKGEGVSYPVNAEFKLKDEAKYVTLLHLNGDKWEIVPSELDGGLKAELPEAGLYAIVAHMSHGPSADGNTYVIKTPSEFIDSVEVPGEPVVVKAAGAQGEKLESMLIVTPFDEKYSLDEDERVRYTKEVEDLLANFDKFLEQRPEFAGTAPSESFDVSAINPQGLKLPASIVLDIDDSDIFKALIVYKNGRWQKVDAFINDDGQLCFTLRTLGSYVVLSEAA